MTEGPYYLDGQLVRADIREDKTGFPLVLTLTVVDDDTCAPLSNALVEIWHCDALGEYSGFVGDNGNDEPDNGTFLRGRADHDGLPRLVPGPVRPYPPQGAHRRHAHLRQLVHGRPGTPHRSALLLRDRHHPRRRALPLLGEHGPPHDPRPGLHLRRGRRTPPALLTLTALGTSPTAGYAGSLTVGVESGRPRGPRRPRRLPPGPCGGGGRADAMSRIPSADRRTETDQPRSGESDHHPIEFIRLRPGVMSSRSTGYSSGEHG
ncbi:hypothetical protein [Streptomyces deccanensis]|uniref:dioxygenase family protein n=1 Tax=Streptomyces deccanensis TaxID=424188 RepID=UPI003B849E67